MMNIPLFQGKLVRLVAPDPDKDAVLAAKWSQDAEYLRLFDAMPARPYLTRNAREWMEQAGSRENEFPFYIRTLADDRSIGYIGIEDVSWSNGDAFVGIGLGDRNEWGKGYGTDAMRVILRYAFTELNLYRLSLNVSEYNLRAIRSYEKAGFVHEGRCRQFLNRDGRRWDLVYMGILKEEWEKISNES